MRETPRDKAASAAEDACPRCGQATSPYRCRDVRDGWFCVQWGLQYDQARLLVPTPDPVYARIDADPQVKATAMLEADALRAYGVVAEAWEKAVVELSTVRIKGAQDRGQFTARGGWRPSEGVRKLARRERQLLPEVERLAKEREHAGEQLRAARVAHHDAYEDARREAGLSSWLPVWPASETQSIIPSY